MLDHSIEHQMLRQLSQDYLLFYYLDQHDDVTVWDYWQKEFTPVCSLVENKENDAHLDTDVLDYGHYVLELKN